MPQRPTDASRPLTVRRRVWAYGAAAVVVIAAIAVLSVRPLVSGRGEVSVVQRDDHALGEVLDLRADLAEFQLFLEPQFSKLSATVSTIDPTDIATGSTIVQSVLARTITTAKTLTAMGLVSDARAISLTSASFTKSLTAFGDLIVGRPLAVITGVVAAERATFVRARAATAAAGDATQDTESSARAAERPGSRRRTRHRRRRGHCRRDGRGRSRVGARPPTTSPRIRESGQHRNGAATKRLCKKRSTWPTRKPTPTRS